MSFLAASAASRITALGSKKIGNGIALRSMTVLSKQSGEEYKKLNYSERMKNSGRPVSPHVTIYSFPITAISSITNRATGCALSFGCAGLGLAEIVGGSGSALSIMQMVGSSSSGLVTSVAKFSVAFPITYHYASALRHLYWDMKPELLTNPGVAQSSYILFGSATALSFVSMFI